MDFGCVEQQVRQELQSLIQVAKQCGKHFVIVSGEVGLGLVPENRLGRWFRDLLGFANQMVGEAADATYFMCSGHALPLHLLSHSALEASKILSCEHQPTGINY